MASLNLPSGRRRVKLYILNARRNWDDRGTGYVVAKHSESLKGTVLLVESESDNSQLLESKILPDTAYQKQQETLIVWGEGDSQDLALSFQEKVGCDEIWEHICQVQGKDPSLDVTQEVIEESEDEAAMSSFDDNSILSPIELPPSELSRLPEISELFTSCLQSAPKKEKLANAIEQSGYVERLIELFKMADDLGDTTSLHQLFEIFKAMFLLNKQSVLQDLISNENIINVIGVLEFDPSRSEVFPHREFIQEKANFKQVLRMGEALQAKIRDTYKYQYILDIICPAPSVFEENLLSALNSHIFFNKVEIVSLVESEPELLESLYGSLAESQTFSKDPEQGRDLVLFLRDLVNFSAGLQMTEKEAFFKRMISMGICKCLEHLLTVRDSRVHQASIDILSQTIEYNPSLVRENILSGEARLADKTNSLLNIMIQQLIMDPDPELGGGMQLQALLKTLLDPENMIGTGAKTERAEFLGFFYKHCMKTLVSPLTDIPVEACGNARTAHVVSMAIDLIAFCAEHHSYQAKNYLITQSILSKTMRFLAARQRFLAAAALRLLRAIVGLKDDFYNRHIIQENIFESVLACLHANRPRYNLLDSALVELFEFIRLEDINSLCRCLVERFGSQLDQLDYVDTFKGIRLRYEQSNERRVGAPRVRDMPNYISSPALRKNSSPIDRKSMDALEEEVWFDQDDDPRTAEGEDFHRYSPPAPHNSPSERSRISFDDDRPAFISAMKRSAAAAAATADADAVFSPVRRKQTGSINIVLGGAKPVVVMPTVEVEPVRVVEAENGLHKEDKELGLVDYDSDSDTEVADEPSPKRFRAEDESKSDRIGSENAPNAVQTQSDEDDE